MGIVWIAAFGVGGATAVGALIGFLFQKVPHRFNDIFLGFAAGVMLAATQFGLIEPALTGGLLNGIVVCMGLLLGALTVSGLNRCVPHLCRLAGLDAKNGHTRRLILFVLAIAMHNLPEGLAAGVSFGTGNMADALMVSLGIALQNLPEGMVVISPLLQAGIPKGKTLILGLLTGVSEVVGTVIGFYAVGIGNTVLPFMLSFAGGTMLYVVSMEMIPESHADGYQKQATFALLIGFCAIVILNAVL